MAEEYEPEPPDPDEQADKFQADFEAYLRDVLAGKLHPATKPLEAKARAECVRQLIAQRGQRYAGCTLENYKLYAGEPQQKAVARLRSFAKVIPDTVRAGTNVILHGPAGTGKDHLMAALMIPAIVRDGMSLMWRDGVVLHDRLHRAMDHAMRRVKAGDGTQTRNVDETIADIVDQMAAPMVLAISDPFVSGFDMGPFYLRVLRQVIDRRYSHGLPVWLTLNVVEVDQAKGWLGVPILDRLRHGAVEVPCNWPSFRAIK